jgi:1,4-dihydroxy-2-naphthoate octaprenyltransferase
MTQMNKTKAWIKAFRLRTLPLSFSAIIIGAALVQISNKVNYQVLSLILLTTLLLQVLSNLANDYGDAVKGTDNDNRVGPIRAIQSGEISLYQMKMAIVVISILALISGVYLLFIAFNGHFNYYFIGFLILGLLAIFAAIKYTIGKKAYGYSAKGDLFVFIFFGLVAVLGTYFLMTKTFDWLMVLPAITIGGFSTAVLNLNNMRDIENDKTVNKITLPVKMGLENAKKYHYSLFFWSYLSYAIFCFFKFDGKEYYIIFLPLIIVAFIQLTHLKKVSKITDYKQFDPELKKIALSALLFSVLVYIAIAILY